MLNFKSVRFILGSGDPAEAGADEVHDFVVDRLGYNSIFVARVVILEEILQIIAVLLLLGFAVCLELFQCIFVGIGRVV